MNGTLLKPKHKPYGIYEKYGKRLLDILVALTVLLLFWWLLVIVAVLVRTKLGSPVIFCQERPGKDEKIFKLYKFRSMTDGRDADGKLLPDDVRLTRFGRLLRATSLDELPELWNILKGDMSLIGPRPLLVKYLPLYTEEQRQRHQVRPGLTGLAQVHGRNATTWEQRFHYDLEYVSHVTFRMDLSILRRTVSTVLSRRGVHAEGSATMEEFRGTKEVEHV